MKQQLILFVDQNGQLGGAEMFLKDLASRFARNCTVLLLSDGPLRELLERISVKVKVIGTPLVGVRRGSVTVLSALQLIPAAAGLTLKVVSLAKKYDIIVTNSPKAHVVGAIASFASRRTLVMCIHDVLSPENFSWLERCVIIGLANLFARRVLVVSQCSRDAFVYHGGKSDKAQVIYNGFDLDSIGAPLNDQEKQSARAEFDLKEGRAVVGCFSRIAPIKGQNVLLKAVKDLSFPVDLFLVGSPLFGEDDFLDALRRQAGEVRNGSRIIFAGFRDDVYRLMQICDVVVCPSVIPEGFGRTVVEAQLLGVPVIATDLGGHRETIMSNETGLLVPPNDSYALKRAIERCLSSQEERHYLSQHGREAAVARFSLDALYDKVKAVMAEL